MQSSTLYLLAADALLLLHTLIVFFIVVGLLLVVTGCFAGWSWVRNPWFRLVHLLAIAMVVLQAWLGRLCPLTVWEASLRAEAGDSSYEGAFIAHWLQSLLYYQAPAWLFTVAYTTFGLLVVASWIWVRPSPFRKGSERRD